MMRSKDGAPLPDNVVSFLFALVTKFTELRGNNLRV